MCKFKIGCSLIDTIRINHNMVGKKKSLACIVARYSLLITCIDAHQLSHVAALNTDGSHWCVRARKWQQGAYVLGSRIVASMYRRKFYGLTFVKFCYLCGKVPCFACTYAHLYLCMILCPQMWLNNLTIRFLD
jgi:hypothetical protein